MSNVIDFQAYKEDRRRDDGVKRMLTEEGWPEPNDELEAFTKDWMAQFDEAREEIQELIQDISKLVEREIPASAVKITTATTTEPDETGTFRLGTVKKTCSLCEAWFNGCNGECER